MNPDEEARSSGESSVLKSPTHFGTSFPPPHGNSFRCPDQLVQGAAAITAPQYDYTVSLAAQQPPLLEAPLRFSDANAHAAAYRNYYTVTLPPRNEISHDYADQDLSHLSHSGRPIVRAQSTSERRLSSGPSSHDSSQPAGEAETSVDKEPPIGNEKPSTNTTMPKQPRGYQRTVSTVVIACRQCRGRKIRCDSTRPVCNNCVRRSNVCEYDLVPKRRGPDKNPGTRHRRCKKRPPDDSTITLPLPNKRQRIAAMDRLSSPSDLVPAPLVPIPKYQENTMASDTPSASSSNKPLERSKTRERLQDHSASPYVAVRDFD
ncbi:hypothetical protein C0989_006525 [Termitomyces sp. Mn162]|nr:hypothetical protein C0989_006525 [Termitomyces sp. Mn162]